MDHIQALELQMAALQRKLRLLQDLRYFMDTSSPDELALFGDELRSVVTASGADLGSALAALLGFTGGSGQARLPATAARIPAAPPPAAQPRGAVGPAPAATPSTEAAQSAATQAAGAARAAEPPSPPGGSEGGTAAALALIEQTMKAIQAGSFVMGSEASDAEKPPHKVTLGAYRVCDHLVTNKEYALFVAANPSWAKDRADPELRDEGYLSEWGEAGYPEGKEDNPVSFVSFYAAEAFASWLGKRLPTEAEWECAARGGLVGKKFPGGDLMNDKLANLAKQYRGTTPAGKFEANGFGLYDMAGNLFEWTADWYGPYSPGEARDPSGLPAGDYKVARGGSWMSGAGALRVCARVDMEPQSCGQVGIRLADGG